ncbi:hypothetical protein BH11MYX1_BH11MYX1_23490 [soil metagenome]
MGAFSVNHVAAFRALSGDANPLHVGARPVVHGALGVLAVVGESVALGTETRVIRHLAARFLRPLETTTAYQVVDRDGDRVVVQDHVDRLVTTFELTPAPVHAVPDLRPAALRTEANYVRARDAEGRVAAAHYGLQASRLDEACRSLGLDLSRLAPISLTALCWASYLVGMELPGRRALLCAFELDLAGTEHVASATELDFSARVDRVDRETARVYLSATLSVGDRACGTAHIETLAG